MIVREKEIWKVLIIAATIRMSWEGSTSLATADASTSFLLTQSHNPHAQKWPLQIKERHFQSGVKTPWVITFCTTLIFGP